MRTVLVNCRLVDGTGRAAVDDAAVAIEGERIVWCGARTDPGAPAARPGDLTVDLEAMTVLPGLFNVHVHLGLRLPFPERRADPFPPGYRVMLNYRRALEAILSGTTSLRVVGEPYFTDLDVREAIARGLLPGPRIKAAGHALIATGGHGHNSVGTVEADGPDGFRRAAREQLRAGADLIKICLTGGIGTPREQPQDKQMTDDEVRAVVEVAHAAGRRVAAHTGGDAAIRDAVRLGVDCIEHGYSFEDDAAAAMAGAGSFLVPTLCVTQELDYLRRHGVQEWMLAKARAVAGEHLASIRRAAARGVTLCCGTDLLPSDPVDGTVATIREVELLTDCGLTPLEAIRAATFNSARLCGVDAETGTLEAGKQADLIAVAGQPDRQIRDLREVRVVMKGGVVFRSRLPGLPDPGLERLGVPMAGGTFARLW
ncbi:MAG: amidohydrolase family protein [Armatimonadota bacterium]|nr:amidohydrolase family protein [Armatimonadota bacterium]MDR7550350.1 amidohydrolase family protein [Armatimonadota bacterium]